MHRLLKIFLAIAFSFCASAQISAQGTYSKIEASFNINSLATDPFDYTVTDVRVQILQPNATTVSLPAFFDGGTTWRVRHTPTMAGTYTVSGVTLNGGTISVGNLQPSSWAVVGPPVFPGFIKVDPSNPRRFITSNGKRFFPRGENVAWDSGNATVVAVMGKMGAAHENWARVWMNHWDGKNLDWPASGPPLPLGQLNLTVAQKWDAIVAAAEQADVHFQMTLQHHGQYSTTVDPNWSQNPYDITNNIGGTQGFLSNPVQFFTNATAKALTKRKLRYAVARWGYSPAIMAWELFNEVQFTDAAQTGQWGLIQAWHNEMALFLRSQDPYHHLITTSSEISRPLWDQTDYYQHHDYPTDLITAVRDEQDISGSQTVAPIFSGEVGINMTTHVGVSPPMWAGLMAAQSGDAMPWYWDTIDANNDYTLFRAVSDFITVSGLGDQNTLNKSAPQVTGGASGSLVFGLGGGFNAASQDMFTVGTGAPDGAGTAPPYLQGNFHRAFTPNGYTFEVNYPQSGTFSVQVLTIASAGAGLQIFLDGNLQTDISFPSAVGNTSTNFTASLPVSAGAHAINISNPGQDWIQLGNLTLNPYMPALAAYAVGNSGFNATWVWNRNNIFAASAGSSATGTVQVAGLNPGTYSATWWDTFAGAVISNFTFTVADTNPVTLNTPAILRSAALYAGLPAQANIVAPNFTRTLGTNSPALNLPLTIANGGGLPLAYSLSVTGANPAIYAAAASTQSGGPIFAWKDISGVGQDITGSFAALAAPKTAKDEGITGPVNLGFAFPFFNSTFSQLYVSPNGFVTFSPFSGDTSANTILPNNSAPSNCIALFWDDLDLTNSASHIYTFADSINGTFTVQFQNVRFKGKTSTVTCQLVLKTTGEILMQYRSMAFSNTCTIGVQNASRTQGLAVAFNQNYLSPNLAVRMTPTAWLGFDGNAAFVAGSQSNVVNVSFNPAGLSYGNYTTTILVQTSDTNQPLVALPVSLAITPGATWRQTHFGTADNSGNAADAADPDHDGIVNIVEFAFNLDPNTPSANPISAALVSDHLKITFKRTHPAPADISYVPEVSDDLASGVWNSGAGYTSQTVTDNGDGTETVTVTDLAPISSTPAHFLRVRIVPQ